MDRPSEGLTAAQKAGLRYEAKAQLWLSEQLGRAYQAAPYLHFEDNSGPRTLIPDGLFFDTGGTALVFEIKSQHMPEAWWQLRHLYEPVVRELGFIRRVSCVEVTKSFDPSMGFPEEVLLRRDLSKLLELPPEPFKVLLWRPQ